MAPHTPDCRVWDWISGDRVLNNTKPCTCGVRAQEMAERAAASVGQRALKPLGMSDYEFLRTLRIDPEADCSE